MSRQDTIAGDCGDIVTSLGAWSIWRAQQFDALLQTAMDTTFDLLWSSMGFTAPAPRLNLEAIL